VSLNDGRVRVRLAGEHTVTVAKLRRVIRRQGFSPREATLKLTARIELRGDSLVAVVPQSGVTYDLVAPDRARPSFSTAPSSRTRTTSPRRGSG